MKTTLFMIMSVDGKISTGSSDERDIDVDFPHILGLKEGLHQYYEIESSIAYTSFNTGRVMAKIGVNERCDTPKKIPCTFILVDNQPHLTAHGIHYLCKWLTNVILITTNAAHPAFSCEEDNLHILHQKTLDIEAAFNTIEQQFDIHELHIQSGGHMNELLLRKHLIDYVDVIVAPVLIGGSHTPTLVDGKSITKQEELEQIEAMVLQQCTLLENNYIRLQYVIQHRNDHEQL